MNDLRKWLFGVLTAISLFLSIAVGGMWIRARTYCDCVNYYPTAPPAGIFIQTNVKCFSISTGPNVVDISLGGKGWGWGTSLNKVEKGFSYRCEKRGEDLTIPDSWPFGTIIQVTDPTGSITFPHTEDQAVSMICDWQPATHGFAGFGWETSNYPTIAQQFPPAKVSVWRLSIPLWFLISIFVIPPFVAIASKIKYWRRDRMGLCANCGYDLRATPIRCPECGTIAKKVI